LRLASPWPASAASTPMAPDFWPRPPNGTSSRELVTVTSGQILVPSTGCAARRICAPAWCRPRARTIRWRSFRRFVRLSGVFARPITKRSRLASVPDLRQGLPQHLRRPRAAGAAIMCRRVRMRALKSRRDAHASPIGVIFNSYDPNSAWVSSTAMRCARARCRRKRSSQTHAASAAHRLRPARPALCLACLGERDIHPITADAISPRCGCRCYGFTKIPGGQMDGAYHRSCIISDCMISTASSSRGHGNGCTARRPPTGSRCRTGSARCGSRSATRPRSMP